MEIVVAGSTGFIGGYLVKGLMEKGYSVTTINRAHFEKDTLVEVIENKDVLINLIGESITGRWTRKKKNKIYNSRIETTKRLISAINASVNPVKNMIQISATGIYDNKSIHNEESKDYSSNFLGYVIRNWENAARNLEKGHTRLVIIRLGVVLGRNGGFNKKFEAVYKMKMGISLDFGNEGFSFIHMVDVKRMVEFIIQNDNIEGIVNGVTPKYTTLKRLTDEMNRIMKPLFIIKIPRFIIKYIFGEGALIFNEGQRVLPEKILKSRFTFIYPDMEATLSKIFKKEDNNLESL